MLQAFGFRSVLAAGVLLAAALTASYGLFTPATPTAVMMALLFVGGMLRSVTFTGVNALAFSDVEDADTGQATAINAVAQQIRSPPGSRSPAPCSTSPAASAAAASRSATSTPPSSSSRSSPP